MAMAADNPCKEETLVPILMSYKKRQFLLNVLKQLNIDPTAPTAIETVTIIQELCKDLK